MSEYPFQSVASDDPRAWRAATLEPPSTWRYRISDVGVHRLVTAARAELAAGAPLTSLVPSPELREALASEIEPLRDALERGRGFAIQEGLEPGAQSDEEATAVYWLLGQCLGRPAQQNVQGTLLYDVRDTGQSVEYGARFSVTNADSSFHTDNSFGAEVSDYVGLLCLRTARSGGINQLVSGWTVCAELARTDPAVLTALGRPYHVDRRGGVQEGEAPTVERPVVDLGGEEPLFRYLRYWIEAGHRKAEVPLQGESLRALDRLDETLRRPDLHAEFSLRAGDILWLNNRWLLHSRTGFQDHDEPERKRHLVRLWLEKSL